MDRAFIFYQIIYALDARKRTTNSPVLRMDDMIIGGMHMMTNPNTLKDELKAQILTLTDRQAEYVLYRLSLLMEEFAAGSTVVSER